MHRLAGDAIRLGKVRRRVPENSRRDDLPTAAGSKIGRDQHLVGLPGRPAEVKLEIAVDHRWI